MLGFTSSGLLFYHINELTLLTSFHRVRVEWAGIDGGRNQGEREKK